MASSILNVTDATFAADVLQHPGLVLVDFWAEWCGPCKALAPILADLAETYPEVRVVKVNADKNKQTMEKFTVRGLPSMLLFGAGEERARLVGTTSKTRLASLLDEHLEGQ